MNNVGDTILIDEVQTKSRFLRSTFNSEWKLLMDSNPNNWTILEVESDDIAKATNRFTTRATRLNAYDYTNGYEFRAIRRSPNALFLGRRS